MRGKMKSGIFAFIFLFLALPFEACGAVAFGPPALFEHRSKSISPPAAAIDDEGRIFIAWLEEEKAVNSIYIAVSGDSGKTFSPSLRVNGTGDEPASIHDAPAIAIGRGGEVYLAWTSKRGEGFSSDLRLVASIDAGKTFAPSVKVNDNVKPASAGFASIAVGHDGAVYVSWLDGRERATKGAGTYLAVSKDKGKSFGENLAVDYNSCPCCRTAVTVGPDKSVYLVWRKIFPNDIREVVMSRISNTEKDFSAPVIVGNDKWEISGCPHRASNVMLGKSGEVIVSWYAEVDGEPGIFLATSKDNGKTFVKEKIETKKGFPDNVTFNLRRDELLLAWQETTPVVSNVVFEARKGDEKTRIKLNDDARKAVNPVISVNSKGLILVTWQKMDMRVMKTAFVIGR